MEGPYIINHHLNRLGAREGRARPTWRQELRGGNSQGLAGALRAGKEGLSGAPNARAASRTANSLQSKDVVWGRTRLLRDAQGDRNDKEQKWGREPPTGKVGSFLSTDVLPAGSQEAEAGGQGPGGGQGRGKVKCYLLVSF